MSILANRATRVRFWGLLLLLSLVVQPTRTHAINSDWNTGNGDWNVAGNWNPVDVPDNGGGSTYDVFIGNLLVAANAFVDFIPEDGLSDTITSLTMSAGADLDTNGNQLFVTGQTTITGVGSSILVNPASGGGVAFNTDNLDINGSAALQMSGGTVDVDVLLEVNSGSITGHGLIIVGDADGVVEVGLENSANIFVGNTSNAVLTLQTNGVDTIDLDGTTEGGLIDVANVNANAGLDTLTLVVDGPLADAFSSTIQVGQRDTITFNDNFTMDGADVQFNGGTQTATMNGPADATNIQNSTFTVTGDTVITNDLTFAGAGNSVTINANSSLTLSGTVNLPPASFNFDSSSAELIVTGIFNSVVVGDDFNWDGPGTATTTISGGGQMILNVDHVDTGNDIYGGTLNLNDNAEISVNNTANEWTVLGTINKNNAGAATISGDRVVITGQVNANAGTLDMPAVTTSATANVNATGILTFGAGSELAGGTLAGTGTLLMESTSTVTANTTIGVTMFDWDGIGIGSAHTINDAVVFTINSATLDFDGDMDDPINLGGNGSQLIVNNTNGLTEWTATAAINANNAGVGTVTIGGTSRLILSSASADLNVNGDTNVTAPLTFGASSAASIDGGFTLDATNNVTYAGGTISGLGTYSPGTTNTVTADSIISVAIFDFDNGSWTVDPGETLTVNVTDYDTTATNSFDGTITLNDGEINVTTGDAEFVMDGVLNMISNNVDLAFANWLGEPLDIGNDSGVLDADVNVSGTFFSRISAPVDFNSDADINIDGVALSLDSTVNFNTVNGVNNAEFTGDGIIRFGGLVNVNEAITLNMVGGEVDLDGSDTVGDFVNIDAPMTINAATMESFGKVNGGGGINTLDINHNFGTGVLTVNLDNAADEWTLNGPGVMNLVNDNVGATLLAGSDVNINGSVNVTGDVGVTARIHLGATGVININTAGQPLVLTGGGSNTADSNTIRGGVINGPGTLNVGPGKGLVGFGIINAPIDFDGGVTDLEADDGILTVNGPILDVADIGPVDADGILNVPAAWNSSVAEAVRLLGGEFRGGAITVDNAAGVQGFGLVTARVINNTQLLSSGGTLIFQTAGNDNDWDGAAGTGELIANTGSLLELRDIGAAFGFTGTVNAAPGGRVFTNGFALDFNPGSAINLTDGTYESTNSTDIEGTVTVNAGPDSTLRVENNSFLRFRPTSTTTLNGNLRVENNNINIDAGATFSGTGALIVPDGSALVADPGANIGVLLANQGRFDPGGLTTVGIVDVDDFQQSATGEYFSEIGGPLLNQLDRLDVAGVAALDGRLVVDLDNLFNPALNAPFDIITAASISGAFHTVDYQNLPAGKTFHVDYLATSVRLTVVNTPFFSADFDDDGDVDSTDLGIWQGAYGLNQLGDADGDNDSDGRDFLIWQQQAGNAPLVAEMTAASTAVPEPGTMVLVLGGIPWAMRRRRKSAASPRFNKTDGVA